MVLKRFGVYYTDFRFEGKRIRRKVPGGIANKRLAEEYEQQLKSRLLHEGVATLDGPPPAKSLKEMKDEYLHLTKNTRSPKTALRDKGCLTHFYEFAGDIPLGDINVRLVDSYRAKRREKVTPRTVNLEMSVLKTMLNKAVAWEIIPFNPIAKVKPLKEATPPAVFLSLIHI